MMTLLPIVGLNRLARSPEEARKAAREILSGKKYRDSEVDTPLDRPLGSVGRVVRNVFGKIAEWFGAIVPGGQVVQYFVLFILVVVAAVLLGRFLVKYVGRKKPSTQTDLEPQRSATYWDRLADEAYAKGDFRSAIVFRFRSGISRLERGPRPGVSHEQNQTIAAIAPTSFPPIGSAFDAVRYGNAPGSAADADQSKSGWPTVVSEVQRSGSTNAAKVRRTRRGSS
jgi:hypothetical protein